MAGRKRKKTIVDEGPFLFSEEEMAGKIENVTIVQASQKAKVVDTPQDSTVVSDPDVNTPSPTSELSSDDRMVEEMTKVLREMSYMDISRIRLIALTTTMKGQQGVDLNESYNIPAIKNEDITGYELAAWCYCSFMEAFPQMKDKLQMPYENQYIRAMKNVE